MTDNPAPYPPSQSRRADSTGEVAAGLEIVPNEAPTQQHPVYDEERSLAPIKAMWRHSESPDLVPAMYTPLAPSGPKPLRRPILAVPALVLFAIASLFFAWVSAEPFWLTVGHGDSGTLTVTECSGGDIAPRCIGTFTAADYTTTGIKVAGDNRLMEPGAVVSAQAVSDSARRAYVGDIRGLYLRWLIGLGLVICCGAAITVVTGAWRLRRSARWPAALIGLSAPLALSAVVLAVAW